MRRSLASFSSFSLAALAALAGFLGACSPAFTIETPPGMIELKNQGSYAYRAMTPDGFVVAVRVIDDPGKADLAFWIQALTLHMKEQPDYAVISDVEVTSANGVKGKELRFRHNEKGKPYLYVVRVFATPEHPLVIVEAGELMVDMDRNKPALDAALASVRLR